MNAPNDGRLVVAVRAALADKSPTTGQNRIWHHVTVGLREHVDLQLFQPGARGLLSRRARRPRPHVWLDSGHLAPGGARSPLVVEVHEVGWHDPYLRSFLDPGMAANIAAATEASVMRADHVITISEHSRQQVLDAYQFDPARTHVVYCGVDLDSFRPGLEGGRRLVAEARHGPEAPYVLYAATLHPRKNLASLRMAMGLLVDAGFPHVLAIVAGPAPDRLDSSDLEREADAPLPEAADRIARIHHPTQARLAALMAGADAFCLPSFSEGFGLTALEAMACGTPVVVSDRGALPEVVGDAGLTVEPTPEGIARALGQVLSDDSLAARLRQQGRARAETFPWSRTVDGWLSVLELAGEAPRTP